MTIPQIKEKIKQKDRLAKHISKQLEKPLDNSTIRLKLYQGDQLSKEIHTLRKKLRGLS